LVCNIQTYGNNCLDSDSQRVAAKCKFCLLPLEPIAVLSPKKNSVFHTVVASKVPVFCTLLFYFLFSY